MALQWFGLDTFYRQLVQWTLFQWGQKWALNREITWKHSFSVTVYMKAQQHACFHVLLQLVLTCDPHWKRVHSWHSATSAECRGLYCLEKVSISGLKCWVSRVVLPEECLRTETLQSHECCLQVKTECCMNAVDLLLTARLLTSLRSERLVAWDSDYLYTQLLAVVWRLLSAFRTSPIFFIKITEWYYTSDRTVCLQCGQLVGGGSVYCDLLRDSNHAFVCPNRM